MATIAGTMHLPQGAAKRFDLLLVSILLTLEHFQHFEDFLHIIKAGSKGIDDRIDLLDGPVHRSLGSPRLTGKLAGNRG